MIYCVVTHNPSDYPGKYVGRLREVLENGLTLVAMRPLVVADTLEEVRAAIPVGSELLGRDFQDDPVILEVWGVEPGALYGCDGDCSGCGRSGFSPGSVPS